MASLAVGAWPLGQAGEWVEGLSQLIDRLTRSRQVHGTLYLV